MKNGSSNSQKNDKVLSTTNDQKEAVLNPPGTNLSGSVQDEPTRSSPWARVFEAATQRRTEVLQPENLENMWTKGRNYKKKSQKKTALENKNGINENSNDLPREPNVDPAELTDENTKMERTDSASDLNSQNQNQVGETIISEFYSANIGGENDVHNVNITSDKVKRTEGYVPKLRCRVRLFCKILPVHL